MNLDAINNWSSVYSFDTKSSYTKDFGRCIISLGARYEPELTQDWELPNLDARPRINTRLAGAT